MHKFSRNFRENTKTNFCFATLLWAVYLPHSIFSLSYTIANTVATAVRYWDTPFQAKINVIK
jgi:hypothetical protein